MKFAYRLALRLGIGDVRGWLAQLPAGALDEWWAYYQLEPWDIPRDCWPDMHQRRPDPGVRPASGTAVRWVSARQAAHWFAGVYR